MNIFEKKKVVSLFFRQSQDQRKEESIYCESAADPASSGKGFFYNQDEWLQEIEEHEHKSDTSEKQSVERRSRSKIRLEEAEEARLQRHRCPPANC